MLPMSTAATTIRRKPARRHLTESAPLKGRVDREAGIIYGVKVVGRSSPNTHGVQGVDGTDYTIQALREALPLYEGIVVNIDHPERTGPPKDRPADQRAGKLRNCKATEDGIYGDLYLLKTHPMADRLLEAAETMPDLFALSHNAYGRGDVQGKRYVITAIPEVKSVDIVSDGGTNRSLFEGRRPMKTTLRQLIECSRASKKIKARLLEMGALCEDDPLATEMEAPPEGGAAPEDAGDWKSHLTNAIGALVADESPESHDIAMKIMKLLGPKAEKKIEEDDEEEEEGGEDKEEKKTEEANRRNRSLCKLAGVEPDTELLESLRPLDINAATVLLSRLSKGKTGNAPRSAPAGSVRVTESRNDKSVPKDAAEQAAALLRG